MESKQDGSDEAWCKPCTFRFVLLTILDWTSGVSLDSLSLEMRLEIISWDRCCSNVRNSLYWYLVALYFICLRSWWWSLGSFNPAHRRAACSPDGPWAPTEQGWRMARKGGHTHDDLSNPVTCLCVPFFSPLPSPLPLLLLGFRAPQVACSVWWWKASVMDLFYIQAQLNWCDSSSLSADQLLYCPCLGVNILWVNEFHYIFCVCVCIKNMHVCCMFLCALSLSHLDMDQVTCLARSQVGCRTCACTECQHWPQKRSMLKYRSINPCWMKLTRTKLCENSLNRQTQANTVP